MESDEFEGTKLLSQKSCNIYLLHERTDVSIEAIMCKD